MERPAIVDILNCFGPGGRNVAQLVTYADGSKNVFGDASFIRAAVRRHRIPELPELTAAVERCDREFAAPLPRSPGSTKRTRKASTSVRAGAGADAPE